MDYALIEDRSYLKILNISALAFVFVPLLGILLPFIFWVMKRDKVKDAENTGKQILNFQITWCLVLGAYYLLLILTISIRSKFLFMLFDAMTLHSSLGPVLILVVFGLINVIYIFLNTVLIYRGKQVFYKPAIRFLK